MKPKLLAVFAHPDDEAFGTGGTLSHYAEQGVEVTLVCATRGEAGEIADPSFATPDTLGEVREAELRCAAEKMGVQDVIFLGYRDSGMAGTAENSHPDAFIKAPATTVVSELVQIIRRVRPHVVATFEPNGGYGHPDHIAIHRHTVTAFKAAGDPERFPELGPGWQPARLFYTAIPRSFFDELRHLLERQGKTIQEAGLFNDPQGRWPDEQVHVIMDVSATVEDKWNALHCHRTQFGPENLFRRLPESEVKRLMSKEFFALAWPDPVPGERMESLFSGLDLNDI